MSLHLHFGNRLDLLSDTLARELGRTWVDPLDPPFVVVPSPSVGKWLKLHLAQRGRTVLNLPTATLESFLWESLDPGPDHRLLRVDALQHAVSACLTPTLLCEPDFDSVRRFTTGPDGRMDPAMRVQLSREAARLFLEYEYNRPSVWSQGRWVVQGIDRVWPDGPFFATLAGTSESGTERWQRRLHGMVFGPAGPLAGTGYLGLPRLHRLRREEGNVPSGKDVHLLSVDKTSHFHRNLLLEMSEHRNIHLYLVNPCMEFWEDLDTFRRRRQRKKERTGIRTLTGPEFQRDGLPGDLWSPQSDPALLRLWGSTARENLVLWCQAADHDFEDVSRDPLDEGHGLLRSMQSALLHRHPGPVLEPLDHEGTPVGPSTDDGSLRILAAPEKLREMEAVRDAIFQWLSEDPLRRPSDVVVYLPNPDMRVADIEAVFEAKPPGHPGHLPISVLGVSGGTSRWARGALSLLEFARSGMDRATLLAFGENPLVRARRGVGESDLRTWAGWMEGTGILHGWDREDRKSRGESEEVAVDAHTARAGLLRLATATLADAPLDLGLIAGWGDGLLPPWRDPEASDADRVEQFVSFLGDLERDLDEFRGKPGRNLAQWGRAFTLLCDRWLECVGDAPEDGVRRSVYAGLEPLVLRGEEPAGLVELAETLRTLLAAEIPGSARAWGGAVTFAPLRPSHILPHGLVVVAGLDGDKFPGEPTMGSLDLLSRGRILGDADPVADNRHAFLLAILSARDRLVISWCARDLQKDEIRPPSSVILELESALRDGFLGAAFPMTALRRAVPLLARTGGILPDDPPVWETPSWDPLATPCEAPRQRTTPTPNALPARISLFSLLKFLENPLFHRIRESLRADTDQDDEADAEMALESDALETSRRCRELLGRFLTDRKAPIESTVREILSSRAWESRSPEGEFLDSEARELSAWAGLVFSALSEILPAPGTGLVQCDLGTPVGAKTPLRLEIAEGVEVRLEGRLGSGWRADSPEPSLTLIDLAPFSGKVPDPHRKARLYLFGAALRDAWSGALRLVWVERLGEGRVFREELPQGANTRWLEDLVGDFLDPACAQFLPLRECLASRDRESIRERLDDPRRRRDLLEELLRPDIPDLEAEAFAALLSRRLGPWLEAAS